MQNDVAVSLSFYHRYYGLHLYAIDYCLVLCDIYLSYNDSVGKYILAVFQRYFFHPKGIFYTVFSYMVSLLLLDRFYFAVASSIC